MNMTNPPHPGGLIAELIEDNHFSLDELASKTGIHTDVLSKIIAGQTLITEETAQGLSVLGVSARLLVAMQQSYDAAQTDNASTAL